MLRPPDTALADLLHFFWADPRGDLGEGIVDAELVETVAAINQSGWVWTTESCSGHRHPGVDPVWIGLGHRPEHAGDLLRIMWRGAWYYPEDRYSTLAIEVRPMGCAHGAMQARWHLLGGRDEALEAWALIGRMIRDHEPVDVREPRSLGGWLRWSIGL